MTIRVDRNCVGRIVVKNIEQIHYTSNCGYAMFICSKSCKLLLLLFLNHFYQVFAYLQVYQLQRKLTNWLCFSIYGKLDV